MIEIDVKNLEEQSSRYRRASHKYEEILQKMRRFADESAASWPGDAGCAFREVWDYLRKDVENEKDRAWALADLLDKIRESAQESDRALTDLITSTLTGGKNG